jgi:apolipoprotein N-acyltransferase
MVQGSPTRLNTLTTTGLALLAGGVHALALAWPHSGQALGALQVLSLAVLAHLVLDTTRPTTAAGLGWCFATAHGVTATWWLYISMHQYGGVLAPLAALAVGALQAALGLYLALALALAVGLWGPTPRRASQVAAFVGAWLLAELARAVWFTGFPWGAAGYAHVDSALAILAPWLGVYGMGAVAALLAMVLALAWRVGAPLMRGGAWVMTLALLLALSQPWRAPDHTQSEARVNLTLLQGNVPQDQKYEAQRLSAPQWYMAQIAQATPGLILAPEIALTLPTDLWPAPWWEALRPVRSDQAVMVGAPWRSPGRTEYSNSVLAWSGLAAQSSQTPATHARAGAFDYRYDKHHLVPFGEFIPWGFAWFVHAMRIPLGEFERGASPQAPWFWGGLRWSPNICYEDLFGEELARSWGGDQAPHVLVNFSNIAWFGDTVAQAQHLNISRMRTLELQRPMVRVTNTGATAVIDHRGVVQAQAPGWQRTVLQTQVEGRSGPPTFYAHWAGRWGLWPLWALAMVLLLLAWALPAPARNTIRPTGR